MRNYLPRIMSFRRLAYTLLSRHFWVGIGVGFLLSSLFGSHFAFADTFARFPTYHVNYCDPSGATTMTSNYISSTSSIKYTFYNSTARTGLGSCKNYLIASTTVQTASGLYFYVDYSLNVISGQCNMGWATEQYGIVQYLISGTSSIQTASSSGTGVLTGNQGYGIGFGFSGVASQGSDCELTVRRLYDSNGVDYLPFVSYPPTSSNSTTTIPLYTPLLTDRLDSMNCTYSSTSTVCVPQYASSTNPVTPSNLFFLTAILLMSIFSTYWVIKKLTT